MFWTNFISLFIKNRKNIANDFMQFLTTIHQDSI
jgi:hypothetical protein